MLVLGWSKSLHPNRTRVSAELYHKCVCEVCNRCVSPPVLQREPEREEQPEDAIMPHKFKRHLNDEEVTGSICSERVRHGWREGWSKVQGFLLVTFTKT